jgi:hypothetical protein
MISFPPPEKIQPHSFRESRRRRDVGATIRSLPLLPVSYPASPCLTFWRVGVVGIFQVAPAMPTNDSLRLDELRTVGTLPRVAHLFPLRPQRDLDQAPENAVSGSSGGGVRLC